MRKQFRRLALLLAASLLTQLAWADRGWRPVYRPGPPNGYAYSHFHGGGDRHFWGTLGVLVGASALYAAMQPRTVYYEPRVVYSPPVYYSPQPTVVTQTYLIPGDQVIGSTTIVSESTSIPPPPPANFTSNVQEGPGSSGAQWWYACRRPAGYYPYVRECPGGWEKVAATPPGIPAH